MAMFCMLQYQNHIADDKAQAQLDYDLGRFEKTHYWSKVELTDIKT